MTSYITNICLDLSGENNKTVVTAKQNDNATRYINITLTDNGRIISPNPKAVFTLVGTKPDNSTFLLPCTLNSDLTVECILTAEVLELSGLVKTELVISSTDETISTSPFRIRVIKSAVDVSNLGSVMSEIRESMHDDKPCVTYLERLIEIIEKSGLLNGNTDEVEEEVEQEETDTENEDLDTDEPEEEDDDTVDLIDVIELIKLIEDSFLLEEILTDDDEYLRTRDEIDELISLIESEVDLNG